MIKEWPCFHTEEWYQKQYDEMLVGKTIIKVRLERENGIVSRWILYLDDNSYIIFDKGGFSWTGLMSEREQG